MYEISISFMVSMTYLDYNFWKKNMKIRSISFLQNAFHFYRCSTFFSFAFTLVVHVFFSLKDNITNVCSNMHAPNSLLIYVCKLLMYACRFIAAYMQDITSAYMVMSTVHCYKYATMLMVVGYMHLYYCIYPTMLMWTRCHILYIVLSTHNIYATCMHIIAWIQLYSYNYNYVKHKFLYDFPYANKIYWMLLVFPKFKYITPFRVMY